MNIMLLGPNIKSQISIMGARDKDALSHLVISNAVKNFCKLTGKREPPICWVETAKSQSLQGLDKLFLSLGLPVSYVIFSWT